MIGLALMIVGALGVVWFAFLSWRALGGSDRQVHAADVAATAPRAYRFAGRGFALMFVVGVVWFFRT